MLQHVFINKKSVLWKSVLPVIYLMKNQEDIISWSSMCFIQFLDFIIRINSISGQYFMGDTILCYTFDFLDGRGVNRQFCCGQWAFDIFTTPNLSYILTSFPIFAFSFLRFCWRFSNRAPIFLGNIYRRSSKLTCKI